MLVALEHCPVVGLDFEMDSFWSYTGKICLVQVSDGECEWIVDPLAVDPLPLGAVCADADRVKVLHDGEYDIRTARREWDFTFRGVFDSRAAVAVLGSDSPGLRSVLEERFDVHVDKKFQRADWTKRPLKDGMIDYAQLDVAYLIPLHAMLVRDLEEKGRTEILETEHRRLEALEPAADPFPVESYGRIKGAAALDGRGRRRLYEVYKARNAVAEAADRAPFRVMGDQALLELAKNPPQSVKEMAGRKGIGWKAARRLGDQLMAALRGAADKDPIDRNPGRKRGPNLRGKDMDRYERIRKWRTKRARREGYDGALLLRREAMESLAADPPAELDALSGRLDPWQIEAFGADLLETLTH